MDGIWDTVAGIAWSGSWLLSCILPFGLALAAWGAVAHRPENPYSQVIPVHIFWLMVPTLVGFSDLIVAIEEGTSPYGGEDWAALKITAPLFAAMCLSWLWSMQFPWKPVSQSRRAMADPLVVPFLWIALWITCLLVLRVYVLFQFLEGLGR
jgi:hypothetical protein